MYLDMMLIERVFVCRSVGNKSWTYAYAYNDYRYVYLFIHIYIYWIPCSGIFIRFRRRLIEAGANIELRDAEGMTPIMWAALRGYIEVVGMLIDHGANVNAQDNSGMTALHIVCFKGYVDLVDHLLNRGT